MFTNLVISALFGAAGGNALGGIVKKLNLGTIGNTLAGGIGGWFAAQVAAMFSVSDMAAPLAGMDGAVNGFDFAGLVTTALAALAGGGVLTGMIGMAKKMMRRG